MLLRVLMVDGAGDGDGLRRELARCFPGAAAEPVRDADGLRSALRAGGWDILLADWADDLGALDALAIARELKPDLPVLVLSGSAGDDVAVAALRAGARDFLPRDQHARLCAVIEREVEGARRSAAARQRGAEDERFFEVAVELFGIADFDGRLLRVNDAWERALGWNEAELIGRTGRELVHPDDRTDAADAARRMRQDGSLEEYECRYRCKDGSYRWLRWSGTAAPDDRRIYLAARDVTRRHAAEQRLASSERRYRVLFDLSPLPKWLYDVDTLQFLEVNDAAVAHYGYSRDEFLRMTLKDIRPPADVERVAALIKTIPDDAAHYGTWRHVKKDGTVIDVEIVGHNVPIEGRRCRLVVANDITEKRRAEAELLERATLAALVAEVGLAVTQADSLEAMLRSCAEALVAGLSAVAARFWVFAPVPGQLELRATAGKQPDGASVLQLGERAAGRIAAERHTRVSFDPGADELCDAAWARAEGVAAFAGYPLVIQGELVGVMELLLSRRPGAAALSALESIAGAVGLGLRRKLVEGAKAQLEHQLRQSQKIEAIGRLTGGIAHDFNNLLSVILSRASFLLEELVEGDPRHADALEIRGAGERAAALTRQLLAFSRKQRLELRVLDLNAVLAGLQPMLRRLIGEDVALAIDPSPTLGSVRADAGQLEQVIVNLAVNARDAMPAGGRLTLKTANVELDAAYVGTHGTVAPGPYVLLSVSDTGTGMSYEVQQHLFEPFFTTKEQGKGTGLGLSTSYGIIQQCGGSIWVYSEPGQGTVFRIYLPRVDAAPEAPDAKRAARDLRGSETVLLVDDDDQVRATAERILRARGYEVLAARSGPEAFALAQAHEGKIDLVLSDVVMPGESGPELAQRLRALRPDAAVLFMSGFTEHAVVEQAVALGSEHLQKPFTPDTLAGRVREALDRVRKPTP